MPGFATVVSATEPNRNSGFSGFPFPFATAPFAGTEGKYPLTTTRRQLIEWWWQVRQWVVTGTVSGGSFGGTWTPPVPFLIDQMVNQYRVTAPPNRQALMAATGTEFSYFDAGSETGLSLSLMPPESAAHASLFSIVRTVSGETARYLPYIEVSGQLLTSTFSTDDNNGTREAQALTVTFAGHLLATYSSPGTADFSGSLVVEPYTYW
jgi:hypothetical protein